MSIAEEDESASAAELRADIAVTRERVASEVDAITDKFSAEHVKRELISAAAELAGKGLRLVKAKPIPFTLVGVGLVLVLWKLRAARS